MALTYLIDVFNLLHRDPETRLLLENDRLTEAETMFLNQVLGFVNRNNCRCLLFFDGMNPEMASKWNHPDMKLVFCHPQSADERMKAHMKNLYNRRAQKKNAITVSDDHAILNFSRRFDIQTMKTDNFFALLNEGTTLPPGKSGSEEKPDSPTDTEIDEYMRLLAEDTRKKQADENE